MSLIKDSRVIEVDTAGYGLKIELPGPHNGKNCILTSKSRRVHASGQTELRAHLLAVTADINDMLRVLDDLEEGKDLNTGVVHR